ncbi:MAG: hypothetical protein EBS64_05780 [Verrucomicrobia bacterium]|nr:hypothetical protein [Verrucomicrobiota bacterium]
MPPPKAKPQGRPHVVVLTTLQPGNKEVRINIKGPFTLRSNAVEFLRVQIDGISFAIPDEAIGTLAVEFPDPETVPPPPPAAIPVGKKKR